MVKRWRQVLVLLLLAAQLLGMMQGASAAGITLTAINDQLLPLSDSTMPTRRGGEVYVPYTVFTGTLGVNNTMRDAQTLILYNLDNTLTFALRSSRAYDDRGNSYSQPAFQSGSTIYVPVKLVCRLFGLSYSNISGSWPILRITNENVSLSDHQFVTQMDSTITKVVKNYQNPGGDTNTGTDSGGTDTGGVTMPVAPTKPTVDIPQPERVYLAVEGAPEDYTEEILEVLAQKGGVATFFLPMDGLDGKDQRLRRIYAQGQTLGLSFTADTDAAALVRGLERANDQMERACGVRTRLVMASDGTGQVTQAQRSALAAAGYRLWRTTLDGRQSRRSAYRTAATVLRAFQKTKAAQVLRLQNGKNTADELRYVLSYMSTAGIPNANIYVETTPV